MHGVQLFYKLTDMEKFRKYIRALELFFLPSWLISMIYGKKIKIGFSLIFVEKFDPCRG